MFASLALFLGIFLAFFFGNPYQTHTKKLINTLLPWSIVGLGFGVNLRQILSIGTMSIWYTFFCIVFTLCIGLWLGKIIGVQKKLSFLIVFGTAICGGSAIAALSPAIKSEHHDTSAALGIVFLLNSLALLTFPSIGHFFNLSQAQFGLWSALSIHDTSSVVGATMQYGNDALNIGTSIKLIRALWLVPFTFMIVLLFSHDKSNELNSSKPISIKIPWFIFGFILAAASVTWISELHIIGSYIRSIAEKILILTLFLIGTSLSKEALKKMGLKPILQGFLLWIIIVLFTLTMSYFEILSI